MVNQIKNLSSDAVWLVTGCSSGLGEAFVTKIAKAGHRVVATARKTSSLNYLKDGPNVLKLKLDVTSAADIVSVVAATVAKFGRIDVLINNAGYGLTGDFEAISDADARKQLETNFWGPVNMTKEVLRVFREINPKGLGGVVVQVSSMGGYIAFPGSSFYHASKFALEGFTESISKEMHPDWNINFLLLEPGGVKTDYAGSSMVLLDRHPAYQAPDMPTSQLLTYLANPNSSDSWSSARDVARLLFDVVSNKGDKALPIRLPVGNISSAMILAENEAVTKQVVEWKTESESIS